MNFKIITSLHKCWSSKTVAMIAKFVFLMLLISLTNSFQIREEKSTAAPSSFTTVQERSQKRLDADDSLNGDAVLTPGQYGGENGDNGLTEVDEKDIPEGALVYVLEEPADKPADGEILETANNIVFRPLFRYRSKQEAQRRNSNRVRRRYFMPRRSYRQAYYYPYYYQRYY